MIKPLVAGDALTTAHTHSAAREYRALSRCHRQQTARTTVAAADRDADHATLPDAAAPEPIEIEPLEPELVVPELNTSTPLTPARPHSQS